MKLKTRLSAILSIFASTIFAQPACPADSIELVHFYNNMNGPNWANKWDLQKPVKTWFGVSLGTSGCVESLFLVDKMRGTMPDLDLPGIKKLTIAATWANDSTLISILPNFSKMPVLEELTISNLVVAPPNSSFPDFSYLPFLKKLSLSSNQFTGGLTDFSHLPLLEELAIANSLATGPVPDFQNLPNLRFLEINESAVTALPDFSKLPVLESLKAHGTSFSGQIPDFQHLINLKNLQIGGVKAFGEVFPADFDGPVPDFSALPKLEMLHLDYLTTSSAIPDFSKIPLLKTLSVTGVNLNGSIPDFHFLPNLESIEIGGWREWFFFIPEQPRASKITGALPDFGNFPNLKFMDFSLNQLIGSPTDFSNLPKIEEINLSNNLLSGTVPAFGNLPVSAKNIQLNSNDLTKIDPLVTVATLDVAYNVLTFEDLLPEFDQLGDYFQQDSIPVQPLYFENGGGKMEIDLLFDENVAGSTYKWFKNGSLIGTTDANNLELATPALPTDRFRVATTNPGAPDLLLVTKIFAVGGQPPVASFEVDQTPGCSVTNFPAFLSFQCPTNPASLVSIKWAFPGGQPATSPFINPFVQYPAPGSYPVTLILGNLFGSDTVELMIDVVFVGAPNAAFSFEQNGLTMTFAALDTLGNVYSWNFGDGGFDNSGSHTVQHTYATPGNYSVQLFFSNSCGGTFLTQQVGVTAAEEPASGMQVLVAPNPTDSDFFVEISAPDRDGEWIETSLFSTSGQLFLEKKGEIISGRLRFDFENTDLVPGLYFLEIKSETGVATRRVLVF